MLLKCAILALLPLCTTDTILFDDGTLYMGEVLDSLSNGQGTCVYTDGTVYEGQWKDGRWDGEGTLRYPDGDVYTGHFSNHRKEGQGTYLYHDGARYDGQWSNDMFNGPGQLVFSDGGRYDGNWKDDRKHGFGKLTRGIDKATFTGYFYNDEFLGYPHDTYLTKDTPLTDELKEWGFQTDPSDDSRLMSIILAYGTKGMLTASISVDFSDHFFGGLTMGFNINPPTWGQRFELVSWKSDDVHRDGDYSNRLWAADIGIKWKNYAIGGMAGIATTLLYQNCRVIEYEEKFEPYGLKQGDVFHRIRQGDNVFAWRAYAKYTFIKKAVPIACCQLGYGNSEGLFAGLGFYF